MASSAGVEGREEGFDFIGGVEAGDGIQGFITDLDELKSFGSADCSTASCPSYGVRHLKRTLPAPRIIVRGDLIAMGYVFLFQISSGSEDSLLACVLSRRIYRATDAENV